MIAFLRHLFLEDCWLKLLSLVLAVLIWLIVSFAASQKEVGTSRQVFHSLPVLVLSSTDDVRNFKVSPSAVEVTVQGDADTMKKLHDEDVHAIVDLTGVSSPRDLRKRVEVAVPPGVAFISVVPQEVQVIFPPER